MPKTNSKPPCPFCGHRIDVYFDTRFAGRVTYGWIECGHCHARGPEKDINPVDGGDTDDLEHKCWDAWEKRAPRPAQEASK